MKLTSFNFLEFYYRLTLLIKKQLFNLEKLSKKIFWQFNNMDKESDVL